MRDFNLEEYLTEGVQKVIKGIAKASYKNPRASVFMMKFIKNAKEADSKRSSIEASGTHIPPFLIASITTECNLHCKGCYARANHGCFDEADSSEKMLSSEEWSRIFDEAEALGIAFILLAGGEPLLRWDVLESAGAHQKIIFPVFTNGTLLTNNNIKLFKENLNLLPVFSIEGSSETTNRRRGDGIYETLFKAMEKVKNNSIVFGTSITVQKNNIEEVTSVDFIESLYKYGCKAIIYVEYVPINKETENIAPTDREREFMSKRLSSLREKYEDLLFISFPGDEKTSGGCLAAGRGFFHINAFGSAEPCPFSAYSDTGLRNVSLKEALRSPLFVKLQENGVLTGTHEGGCVLFEKDETVKELCKRKQQ